MKKVFTLLTVALAFAGVANAQRTVDAATSVTAPAAGSTIQGGTPINLQGTLTNNGPDIIKGGADTLVYQFSIGGGFTQISGSIAPSDVAMGGSLNINLNNIVIGGEDNAALPICFHAAVQNRDAGGDSVKNEVALGTFANNSGCNNYDFKRGYPAGINKDEIYFGNGFTVSPNPASDVVNLTFLTNESGNTTIRIFDITGKLVKEVATDYSSGMVNIQLSVNELPVGLFTAQMNINGTVATQKVAITR